MRQVSLVTLTYTYGVTTHSRPVPIFVVQLSVILNTVVRIV